jgi:hypothetical protein
VLNLTIVVISLMVGGYLAFSKRLAGSKSWKATVTPLASIMGSGFLVSAPLLASIVGNLSVICMAILLVLAYMVGGAIRFNIRHFEPIENEGEGAAQAVAFMSRIVLVAAYFVTVTYYLELLAAFLLKMVDVHSQFTASLITTVFLLVIGGIGMLRGLDELEVVEKYAVSFNLGMIAALLVALAAYNAQMLIKGEWALQSISSEIDFHDLRVLLGLLIVVQGFETSRYLGDEHPADQRISTMRLAQLISSAIYIVFIALATVLFHAGFGADVTAIIDMTRPIAVVLPVLLAVAAMSSQFSAAVADDEGAGGLIEEITQRKVSIRYAYLLILLVTGVLAWSTNVNEIIAYASRAFALYYALQCAVALIVAWQSDVKNRTARLVTYSLLTMICLLVFAVGLPSG